MFPLGTPLFNFSQQFQIDSNYEVSNVFHELKTEASPLSAGILMKEGSNLKNIMDSKKKVDDDVNNFQREMSWLPGKKNEALDQSFNIKLFNTENPFLNNQNKEDLPNLQNKSVSVEEIKSLTTKLRFLPDNAIKGMDRYTINELRALSQAIEIVINFNQS